MRRHRPVTGAGIEVLESRVHFSFGAAGEGAAAAPALPAAPPQRFVIPIGGVGGVDWAVTAYTDRDPGPEAADYRGGKYTFDGSTAVHFALADFAAMDRGVEVYAAAAGTVLEVRDGQYDRHLGFQDAPPPGTHDNYVLVDHGDGWRTRYGRLRNGSVAVSPGQVVSAGQRVGLVGGSGSPSPADYAESGAHLRFEVRKDGAVVEPFLDPGTFWEASPPYAGDAPGVHNMFTADALPSVREAWEGISRRRVFHRGEVVNLASKWHGRNQGVPMRVRYYLPNGNQIPSTPTITTQDQAQGWHSHAFSLGPGAPLGTYLVAAEINGVEYGRTSFVVADPARGLPEAKVFQGNTYVVDGRTTAIDFGTVKRGAGHPGLTFTVYNHGTAPLELRSVTVPEGFNLSGGVPSVVPPTGWQDVAIELDDEVAGLKGGRVTIHTNDGDNAAYHFAVKGTVVVPPGAVGIYVDGTSWTESFREFLEARGLGDRRLGFAVAEGGVDELAALPWTNINRIHFRFAEDLAVQDGDLSVTGVAGVTYGLRPDTFGYDPATFTASWTLDKPLANYPAARPTGDAVTLELRGRGLAETIRLPLNVVPGDANRNGNVGPTDFGLVRSGIGRGTGDVGAAPREYSVFKDVNGDGAVSPADLGVVRGNMAGAVAVPASAVVWGVRRETESEGLFGTVSIL